MVAEHFVELDELAPVLLEPVCEPHVQVGACFLRQRVVRRVADQQMPEPKRMVSRERRGRGVDQLFADET